MSTGFWVPHFWLVNSRVLTKKTSALKGELKPYFQAFSLESTGIFSVERV